MLRELHSIAHFHALRITFRLGFISPPDAFPSLCCPTDHPSRRISFPDAIPSPYVATQITSTDLASFLEERRAQGYLVVAVEQVVRIYTGGLRKPIHHYTLSVDLAHDLSLCSQQAANSSSLEAFQFPKQTLLLLGNEQNGVPASLLEQVDTCIEVRVKVKRGFYLN